MGHKQDLDITFNALETRKNGDNSWTELNSMENLQKQIFLYPILLEYKRIPKIAYMYCKKETSLTPQSIHTYIFMISVKSKINMNILSCICILLCQFECLDLRDYQVCFRFVGLTNVI